MLKEEIGPFNEINLAIGLDEVVTDWLDVVDYHKPYFFVFYSLSEVDEHFVVVLQGLAVGENDVLTDLLLRNFVLILHQKEVFDLIKSLLIQGLTCHQIERLAF